MAGLARANAVLACKGSNEVRSILPAFKRFHALHQARDAEWYWACKHKNSRHRSLTQAVASKAISWSSCWCNDSKPTDRSLSHCGQPPPQSVFLSLSALWCVAGHADCSSHLSV